MRLTTRLLAEWLHTNYQEVAEVADWKTQSGTNTSFDVLPKANRKTMLFLADRLINLIEDLNRKD